MARQQAEAAIAQLGERQTEDLEVPGSIPGYGNCFRWVFLKLFGSTPFSNHIVWFLYEAGVVLPWCNG